EIVSIFGFATIDVARNVEVVIVRFDHSKAYHARVARQFELFGKDIDDLVEVLAAQAVLVAVLHETLAGIDHEDAGASVGVFLVDDNDAGGNAGAVEQVGGQADDTLDKPAPYQVLAD